MNSLSGYGCSAAASTTATGWHGLSPSISGWTGDTSNNRYLSVNIFWNGAAASWNGTVQGIVATNQEADPMSARRIAIVAIIGGSFGAMTTVGATQLLEHRVSLAAAAPPSPAAGPPQQPSLLVLGAQRGTSARLSGGSPPWNIRQRRRHHPVPAPPPKAMSPAEAEAAEERWRARVLAAHDAEGVDTAWAVRADKAFSPALSAAAQTGGFELEGMDCRTTSCVASLRWPSYSDALNTKVQLLLS